MGDMLPLLIGDVREGITLEMELKQATGAVIKKHPAEFLTYFNTLHKVAYEILNDLQKEAETTRTEKIMEGIIYAAQKR